MYREVDFLDLGRRDDNTELIKRLASVGSALSNRDLGPFLVLGGEQRAIGDLLVDPDSPASGPPQCLSYPAFRDRMRDDARSAQWFQPLLDDIDTVLTSPTVPPWIPKTRAALAELIDFLDRHQIARPWAEQSP